MPAIEKLQNDYVVAERESELWCRLAGRAIDNLDRIAAWEVAEEDDDAAGQMVDYAEKAAADLRIAYGMQYTGAIRPAEVMPTPDTLVQLHGGQVQPAMFFYVIEGQSLVDIASEHGFDCQFGELFGALPTVEECEAEEAAYNLHPDKVLAEWNPTVPEGWQFGGKWHGEEGPVACFLRNREISKSLPQLPAPTSILPLPDSIMEVLLLAIFEAMHGQGDSSEYKHHWLNMFTGDERPGIEDTFNRCNSKGWLHTTTNTDTDQSTTTLTPEGRARLAQARGEIAP